MQLKKLEKKKKTNTLKGNRRNELIKIKQKLVSGGEKKKQKTYSTTNRAKSWILGRKKKQKARAKTR